MFERFSESSRRAVFFARYETAKEGDAFIRCIHLVAGIAKEDPQLFPALHLSQEWVDALREGLRPPLSRMFPTDASVDVPLDDVARRALITAVNFANERRSRQITLAHLLASIFDSDSAIRQRFEEAGVDEQQIAELCDKHSDPKGSETDAVLGLPVQTRQIGVRAGIAYDLHRLEEGRKFILGGVEIAFDKGPAGHSDGDVLSHAICDALLGAAGLGDIGTHFPDTDPQWKGANSLRFLEHARKLLDERGLRITHIDAVVVTEKPKLVPHFPAIREVLAKSLGLRVEQINLKAKTNEGVDAIGRGEAIATHAVATVEG